MLQTGGAKLNNFVPTNNTQQVLLALEWLACTTGNQAGALLVLIELLTHDRPISLIDAMKLVSFLSSECPEARRRVFSRSFLNRKAKPIRPSVSAIRR